MSKDRYFYELPKKGSGRFYLWRGKGHPKYRVDPDAPDFERVYGNFRAGISPQRKAEMPSKRPSVLTFQQGLVEFYKSSPYIRWKTRQRRQWSSLLDRIAEERVNPDRPESRKVGDVPLDDPKWGRGLQRLLDRKIEQDLYGAAIRRRKALRRLWAWFHENEFVRENIALRLPKVTMPKQYQRRHTITEAEVRQYREFWAIGTKARLGFELGMAGASRIDVVKLGPQHLAERGGVLYLEYYRHKTLHLPEPELAVVEVHEDLAKAIREHVPTRKDKQGNPVRVIGHTTFLVTEKGSRLAYDETNYGEKVFKEWVRLAGLPPRVTSHSLRRGAAVDLLYQGYSHEEINTAQGRAKGSRVISAYLKDLDKRKIADLASARRRRERAKNETGSD